MIQNGDQGYEHWRRNGATTFHEYWDSNRSRSHNHPMFGAPVAYIFEYLLGIRQRPHTAGYTDLLIAPQAVSKFGRMAGSMETPNGTVAVGYEKTADGVAFRITVPQGTKATFCFADREFELQSGNNSFTV